MRQTNKGNQWYFNMKEHIGVDAVVYKTGNPSLQPTCACRRGAVTKWVAFLSGIGLTFSFIYNLYFFSQVINTGFKLEVQHGLGISGTLQEFVQNPRG
jgi:hypothetical protein